MRIKNSKHSKPKLLRLRKFRNGAKASEAQSLTQAKPLTPIQRFFAVPTPDFKFLSDHLKNYFTVGGLCLVAGFAIKKGTNYDKTFPWLGIGLGGVILIAAVLYGGMNSIQMTEVLRKARKGRLWVPVYWSAMILMSFFLGAVIAQALEKV